MRILRRAKSGVARRNGLFGLDLLVWASREFRTDAVSMKTCSKWALAGSLLVASFTGCASMKESDTARTGLEQLLISNAVDQSLAKVDFTPIGGAKVHLKTDLLDCVDKNYIILSTRAKLLVSQCVLMDKADEADVVLEIASGGVGTDRTDLTVGSPEIPLGLMGSIPKVNIYERKKAMGTAKLVMVATDTKSKQAVINSGFSLARSDHQHWTMMGTGPVLSGSVATQLKEHTGQSETLIYMPPTSSSEASRTATKSEGSSLRR